MYGKGERFVGAALFLRKADGDSYVVLHLLCQGIELLLKGLLLHNDYDLYRTQLKRPLGHDLIACADAVADAFGRHRAAGSLRRELVRLADL